MLCFLWSLLAWNIPFHSILLFPSHPQVLYNTVCLPVYLSLLYSGCWEIPVVVFSTGTATNNAPWEGKNKAGGKELCRDHFHPLVLPHMDAAGRDTGWGCSAGECLPQGSVAVGTVALWAQWWLQPRDGTAWVQPSYGCVKPCSMPDPVPCQPTPPWFLHLPAKLMPPV